MRAWVALVLVFPLIGGCMDFLDDEAEQPVQPADVLDDPADYSVSGVRVWPEEAHEDLRVPGFGGTELSVKVYEPLTRDARDDGGAIRFPVLFLFHPWGQAKEYFENIPLAEPGPDQPDPRVNMMERFANQGFITVAYDNRGFGRSDGTVTIAGTAELGDFQAIHRWVTGNFTHNGFVGVAGNSLGAGTSLRMMADTGVVDAAASIHGWTDLYDALLPGHTPKAEWAAALYGVGQAGSRGRLHSDVDQWMASAIQREDLASVEAAMDTRSTGDRLGRVETPLLLCQGLQESLFPQIDRAWEAHGGFVRSYVYTGGHSTSDVGCWDRIQDWMDYFLRGVDTNVDDWPFLETVDADATRPVLQLSADALETQPWIRYLHDESLVAGPSSREFTVDQRLVSNPLQEPSVIGDSLGQPSSSIPEELRQDPFALFFDSGPFASTEVILGSPRLLLEPVGATGDFQVVATLYLVDEEGQSRPLTRGALTHKDGVTPDINGTFAVDLHWTKATVEPDSRLVLKVSANDNGWFMTFPGDYSVTFSGSSHLDVPMFG